MKAEAREEHRWLARLAGEWTYVMEGTGPDGQVMRDEGTATGRMIGELWVQIESRGDFGGESGLSQMTLGYDAGKGKVVGTFLASVMDFIWIYEGTLDRDAGVLRLDTEGPDFTTPGGRARYVDWVEMAEDGTWTLRSTMGGADATDTEFMRCRYTRR